MLRLVLLLFLPLFFIRSSTAQFLGAEMAAHLLAPHELKIYLNTYSSTASDIPESEWVSVFGSSDDQLLQQVKLAKQEESIDFNYPLLDSFKTGPPPQVYKVSYSATIRLTKPAAIIWKQTGLPRMINNIIQNGEEALGLKVVISNPADTEFNVIPMLSRLPLLQVKTNHTGNFLLDIKEPGETDIVDVQLTTPWIFDPNEKEKSTSVAAADQAQALDKVISFDRQSREITIDKLPFGNYLLAFTISDQRNLKTLSSHQAVFLIQSIQ